jgi:hypothetical protein
MSDKIPPSAVELLASRMRTRQRLREYCDEYGISAVDDGDPVDDDERVLRLVRRFVVGIGHTPAEIQAFETLSALLDKHHIPAHPMHGVQELPFLVRLVALVELLESRGNDE